MDGSSSSREQHGTAEVPRSAESVPVTETRQRTQVIRFSLTDSWWTPRATRVRISSTVGDPPGPRRRRQEPIGASPTRANAARKAVNRRSPLRQYEWRRGAGIFRRRHCRRHHHLIVAIARPFRHRPQLDLHLQGPRGRCKRGRARVRSKAASAKPATGCGSRRN